MGHTPWSRARRAASYYLCFPGALAALDPLFEINAFDNWPAVAGFAVFSVVFFLWVVLGAIFLTSEKFRPNPRSLALDKAISIVFAILALALVYRISGISLEAGCSGVHSPSDFAYLSAVDFSTIGNGDLRPCPEIGLTAEFQAIFGNLHLGQIMGSAFFLAQISGTRSEKQATDNNVVPRKNTAEVTCINR